MKLIVAIRKSDRRSYKPSRYEDDWTSSNAVRKVKKAENAAPKKNDERSVVFDHAINYVTTIKRRFISQPEICAEVRLSTKTFHKSLFIK